MARNGRARDSRRPLEGEPLRSTHRRSGAVAALLLGLALGLGPATPAEASPETLRRSVSNLLFAPFDLILSPVVAARTIARNLDEIDDSTMVRIVYPVPGFVWNTGVQMGAATIRAITGALEFVPGLGLFFFETDLDPLYAPAERGDALVDEETPPLHIKFGIDYTTVPY